ncbi:hypothetical protein DL767_003239 [Monosporascus sp. MG133]|nr:hypothetical protein DL767_003239 [Monosporascus sp. MG133]
MLQKPNSIASNSSDYDSYLIRNFIPKSRQDAYDAFRAFNLELVRLPELVSNPAIGQLRMQFWRDAVNNTFAGKPPKEPIMILLHKVLRELKETDPYSSPSSIKFWLQRLISTREKYMDNRPFISLAALEEYAENTYSTLMYSTLAALPIRSMHMDHLASHIGKACGIVAVLRGVPVLAAPSPPVKSPSGAEAASGRSPVLLLPLDVMAEAGLREEDVYREGPRAEGFQDAVFKVATRAHDHLITAREMLKNIRTGQNPGHEYEHGGEAEHQHPETTGHDDTARDMRRGFGVLLEAVPAQDYLSRLEAKNFDPFAVRSSWKLPWRISTLATAIAPTPSIAPTIFVVVPFQICTYPVPKSVMATNSPDHGAGEMLLGDAAPCGRRHHQQRPLSPRSRSRSRSSRRHDGAVRVQLEHGQVADAGGLVGPGRGPEIPPARREGELGYPERVNLKTRTPPPAAPARPRQIVRDKLVRRLHDHMQIPARRVRHEMSRPRSVARAKPSHLLYPTTAAAAVNSSSTHKAVRPDQIPLDVRQVQRRTVVAERQAMGPGGRVVVSRVQGPAAKVIVAGRCRERGPARPGARPRRAVHVERRLLAGKHEGARMAATVGRASRQA